MKTCTQAMGYRPDIDGLRAFAVLSVVAYHAFPEWVKGGFIGVDVFFVISGYLIGGIILRDLEQGTFTFRNFYGRRIRRIFPALVVVLASTLAFGWFALLPDEYKALGKHVLGGSTFVSNFVLWQEAGYFDVEAKAKPLLHLWSLGIEEQFYIFFPLLLWFCFRRRLRIPFWIALLLLASFCFNIYLHNHDKTADFYSPLTRVWELFSGVVCVLFTKRILSKSNKFLKYDCAVAALGVIALVTALLRIDDSIAYPGWVALLPVTGAMCLILADSKNWISKWIFANPVTVFIGKVSYPFYLWHWVFISFAFIINAGLEANTHVLRIGLVITSFILSILTYLFIEKPIRFNIKYKAQKIVFLIICIVFLARYGYITYVTNGFTSRNQDYEYINNINDKFYQSKNVCKKYFNPDKSSGNVCHFSGNIANATLAFIGDSHARHLLFGFIYKKIDALLFWSPGIPPYIDILNADKHNNFEVHKPGMYYINESFKYIAANNNIHTVVLAHRPLRTYKNCIDIRNAHIRDRDVILENGMRRTFDFLQQYDKSIIVILDNPRLPFRPEKCTERHIPFISSNNICNFDRKIHAQSEYINWYKRILFKVIKDYKNIKVLDMASLFCDDNYCHVSNNGKILYRDRHHLSIDGSIYVSDTLLQLINGAP